MIFETVLKLPKRNYFETEIAKYEEKTTFN